MPRPTPVARAALDKYIEALASMADGLTLEDFRAARIVQSRRTERRVKFQIVIASALFMALAIGSVFTAQYHVLQPLSQHSESQYNMSAATLWALALGGLGAVASIFLHVLKLMPQETLRASDEFEVLGRLVLGCLFGTILAMTIAATEIAQFFAALGGDKEPKGGSILLVPFLAGYSIPLVLRMLEKVIRAVELTIGTEESRDVVRGNQRRLR
jgi:hypothetical protein